MTPEEFQKHLDSCSPEFAAMLRKLCKLSQRLLMENVCLRAVAKRTFYLETTLLHALTEWTHYYAQNMDQYCHHENAERLRDFEKFFREEWQKRKEVWKNAKKEAAPER